MNHVPVWSLYLSLQWWNLNKPRCWRGLGDLETHLLGCWGLFVSRAQDVAADLHIQVHRLTEQITHSFQRRERRGGGTNRFGGAVSLS